MRTLLVFTALLVSVPSWAPPYRCGVLLEETETHTTNSDVRSLENTLRWALSFIENKEQREQAARWLDEAGAGTDVAGQRRFRRWWAPALAEHRGLFSLSVRRTLGRLVGADRRPIVIRWNAQRHGDDLAGFQHSMDAIQRVFAAKAGGFPTWIGALWHRSSRNHAQFLDQATRCLWIQYLVYAGWTNQYGTFATLVPELEAPVQQLLYPSQGRFRHPFFRFVQLSRVVASELDARKSDVPAAQAWLRQRLGTHFDGMRRRNVIEQRLLAAALYATMATVAVGVGHDLSVAFRGVPAELVPAPQQALTAADIDEARDFGAAGPAERARAVQAVDEVLRGGQDLTPEEREALELLRKALGAGDVPQNP